MVSPYELFGCEDINLLQICSNNRAYIFYGVKKSYYKKTVVVIKSIIRGKGLRGIRSRAPLHGCRIF